MLQPPQFAIRELVFNVKPIQTALPKQQLSAQEALASDAQIRVNALVSLPHRLVIVLQESVSNVLII